MSTAAVPQPLSASLGPEPASPIEPPPRARLEALHDELAARRELPPPGLPRGMPRLTGRPARPPSLLVVGEVLSDGATANLRKQGFRKAVDVEDLADALGALSERRYDSIAIWDHVSDAPVRFIRALLDYDRRGRDPLLPLLASRVRGVPIALLHAAGGYAVFRTGGEWYLSEPRGPAWSEALLALTAGG